MLQFMCGSVAEFISLRRETRLIPADGNVVFVLQVIFYFSFFFKLGYFFPNQGHVSLDLE